VGFVVPSGAACSCHQAHAIVANAVALRVSDVPNASNIKSLTVVAASRFGGQLSKAARQRLRASASTFVLLTQCLTVAPLLPALPNRYLPEDIP
jgi:hypothetical protein